MTYATMTKAQLLDAAKTAAIVGRWDMTKDQLVAALDATHAQPEQPDDEVVVVAETTVVVDAEAVLEAKRRYPSEARRDETGKVVRLGVKLNDNKPFANKFYYLAAKPAAEVLAAAPPQVRAIVEAMARYGVTSADLAMTGADVVAAARRAGLTSKSGDAQLFAYYRRLLEKLGVVHAA